MILLSILIPTLKNRKEYFERLTAELHKRIHWIDADYDVEVIDRCDEGQESIGAKRNWLLNEASGKYVAFIDDDDRITSDYINEVLRGAYQDVDCCSLKGIITEDGKNPLVFEHSIKYKAYKTNPEGMPVRYERYPNHLNAIRRSIAQQFKFPEINHGEDTDWATQIFKSGLIKTEYYIDEIIYYYDYRSKK